MNLRLIILGLSTILSCVFVSEVAVALGIPERIGDVPMIVIIGIIGVILMMQGAKRKVGRRKR